MARFSTLALLLVALASLALALAADVPRPHNALRQELPAQKLSAQEPTPVLNKDELPVLSLEVNASSSAANDTAAVEVVTPTQRPIEAVVPPEPSYHPVFGLIFATLALCVTSNVADQDTTVAIAATAGILTTIYTLIHGLDLQAAIALSAVTLTGSSLAKFVDNVRDCARDAAARPLIDWDVLLLIEPALLLGVLGGILLRSVLLPSWLLSTALATMLLVCGSLLLQASHRRTDENAEEGFSINEESSLVNKRPATGPAPPFSIAIQTTPLNKLGVLVGVVLTIAVLHAALAVAVPIVLLGYLAYKAHKSTFDAYEHQQLPRASVGQGEIKWTTMMVRVIPAVSALSGAATGLVGFGSELIMTPYLVSSGLDRAVASSTGSSIVLLASLLTALECVVLGSVSFTVVVLAMIVGFVTKEFSHLALEHALSESLRTQSFIAFSFAVITLTAGVGLAIAST